MSIWDLTGAWFILLLVLLMFIFPVLATGTEILCLIISLRVTGEKREKYRSWFFIADLLVIFAAIFLEVMYMYLSDVMLSAEWTEQLYNDQKHMPVYSGSLPTVIVIALLAFAGFCVLSLINVNKTPPLIPVIAMSMLYAGLILAVVFTFHVAGLVNGDQLDLYLLLPPLNFILMSFRVIYGIITDYDPPEIPEESGKTAVIIMADRLLRNSRQWPFFALLIMLPLLGALFCILMLFGQTPDAAIRAFTETADFRLSQMTPPQNLYYDEHYLCTVAAGGDPRVVKPVRMGVRHGHKVVVNRQLCIANAFEQILEERTPRLHRAVRGFYDTYGFPVARLIKRKKTADIVYYVMKPAEWVFLAIIYLTDVHPEDRIAMQYTGADIREVLGQHGN